MRNRLVTLLILLMTAFPVWSASTVCCHLQMAQAAGQMSAEHPCCEHMQMEKQHCQHASSSGQTIDADNCQCDQFQHSQFVLSLPDLPIMQPVAHFVPERSIPTPLAERQETIIRPPIT